MTRPQHHKEMDEMIPEESLTRQEQLKEIGEMVPQEFMSQFIIPFPHKFYDNAVGTFNIFTLPSNVFDDIEDLGWEILNEKEEKQLGAFYIKQYIYDHTIPKLENNKNDKENWIKRWKKDLKNKKKYLENNSSLLLRKTINKEAKINNYTFMITDIDLWIFEEHIGFFVLNVDIDHKQYTIDELSEFNKQFREFKFLECQEKNNILTINKANNFAEPHQVLEHLLTYTQKHEKSFLNITKDECLNSPIYNSSTNAKLMTAVQTDTTTFSKNNEEIEIEPLHTSDLHFMTINGTSTLEEVPYYLASCSSLSPTPNWTNNEEYIHSLVNNGGFNIWKYSSGITIHDSFALFGLSKDGGPVVSNMKNSFYFIYILNLYINFQIRFIEHKLISQDFDSLDITYRYKQLQKLKNEFISKEIGIKFQENELHNSILSALKTEDMLSQVTENLMETKEITQSHFGIYMTLVGFIAVTTLEEPLTNFITSHGSEVITIAILSSIILWKFKGSIKKVFRKFRAKISNR